MRRSKEKKTAWLFVVCGLQLLLTSCGAASNVLGVTTPREHRESFELMLSEASAAYDRNDLSRAYKLAEKCYEMAPNSERAATLFGFINLALAGSEPFQIAQLMAAASAQKKTDEPPRDELDQQEEGERQTSSTPGAADVLAPLKAKLGLDEAELALIGDLDTIDQQFPVYIPKCAEEARLALKKLQYVGAAISAACNFVDPKARHSGDVRQRCVALEGPPVAPSAQAHILWSFAHLTEAIAFQSLLTYGGSIESKTPSNLEQRALKLKQSPVSADGMADFVAAVESLGETLKAVMATGDQCSEAAPTTQLHALLNDLLAAQRGFASLSNAPPEIGGAIVRAMARISQLQDLDNPAGTRTLQATELKADLAKNVAASLREKIDGLGADGDHELSGEQKEKACAAFAAFSGAETVWPNKCQ